MSRRDAEQVYDALFINTMTAFETFLEDLFLGLLVDGQGLSSEKSTFSRRVTIRSHKVAREIVIGPNRKYVDWLPYDQTEGRAKLFFRGGRPFTVVSTTERNLLKRCSAIRNRIAHNSRHSNETFQKVVIGNLSILPRDRTPSRYLRSLFRLNPAQTRYENLAAEILRLARRLAK